MFTHVVTVRNNRQQAAACLVKNSTAASSWLRSFDSFLIALVPGPNPVIERETRYDYAGRKTQHVPLILCASLRNSGRNVNGDCHNALSE